MTAKERMEAAFSAEGSHEFPVVLCYEDIFYRDHWQSFVSPWWHNRHNNMEKRLQWHRELVHSTGQDWMTVPLYGYSAEAWQADPGYRMELGESGPMRVNLLTGDRQPLQSPQVSGAAIVNEIKKNQAKEEIESFPQLDELIPLPQKSSTVEASQPWLAHNRMLHEFDDYFKVGRVSSPLWMCALLWGYEDYLVAVATRPELLQHACERYLHIVESEIRGLKALGAQAIWIEECFTDLISPESFKSLNMPVLSQLIEIIHGHGLKSIYYFTGDPRGKLSMILQTNSDGLSFEEGKKGFSNDIAGLVQAIDGKSTLLGNLDAIGVLQNGSEEELQAAIFEQIQAGRRNKDRFIISLGSPVTPQTSLQRTRLYCKLAHELGK